MQRSGISWKQVGGESGEARGGVGQQGGCSKESGGRIATTDGTWAEKARDGTNRDLNGGWLLPLGRSAIYHGPELRHVTLPGSYPVERTLRSSEVEQGAERFSIRMIDLHL